ncbi:MAG: DUF554 domain-containing protein [Candidatus Ornithospirochaeta sp.]
MFVTLVNAIAVVIGTIVGLLVKKKLPSSFRTIVMTSSGLVTIVLGLSMAGSAGSTLGVLFALIVGGFIGFGLRIEERIESFGNRFQKDGEEGSFGLAFLNSSVLFCSGAMSVVGSINAGTTGDGSLILIKSVMDGFMAIVFASTYGKGVMLSALTVLVYQGFFVLAGSAISPILGESGIQDIASAGGYLLLMIGLSLLDIRKTKTANFLPALVLAPIFGRLFSLIS